jgi:hypothetical protein
MISEEEKEKRKIENDKKGGRHHFEKTNGFCRDLYFSVFWVIIIKYSYENIFKKFCKTV